MSAPYVVAAAVGFLCSLLVGFRAWSNRERKGATSLTGIAVTAAFWTGGTVGLVLSSSPAVERLLFSVSQIGIVGGPIAIATFALEYTGYRRYLTRRTVGGLVAAGAGFVLLKWTDPVHGLYYSAVETGASTPTGVSTSAGPGFWLFVVFSYVLLAVGSVLLVRYAFGLPKLYRKQTAAILVAVLVPWAANVPVALQAVQTDYTPVGLAVTALSLSVAMFRYELADIGPVALRRVFETISTGVYVLDRDDRLVEINRAGREMLGVTEDAIGAHARTLAPNEEFYERFRGVDEGQELVEIPAAGSGDGSSDPRYYDVRVRPVETTRSERVGRIFVVSDVTRQHRQQQRLERQRDQFEEFASVVSHDLRNPLNVAAGNVALAQDEFESDRLDDAERALARMEALIDDLLELAREGEAVADPEPVGLSSVVAESWAAVDTSGATLVNDAGSTVVADRSRLRQLVENLVRNAIEHGDPGVTVTVGDSEDGFYVADDGPGIPPEDRETVLEDGYTTSDEGTGLGLSIVERIATAHGWDLHVAESDDGGARFEITGVETVEPTASAPD